MNLYSCQMDLLVREDICALPMAIKRKVITTCSYRSSSIFYQKDQNAVSSVCSKFQSEEFSATWLKFCAFTCIVYPLNKISKLYGCKGCACSLSLMKRAWECLESDSLAAFFMDFTGSCVQRTGVELRM